MGIFTHCYRHALLEVGSSNPGRGKSYYSGNWQGFLHQIWHIFSILNLFTISSHGEAVNYRSCVSPSFEVASYVK